MERHIVAPAEEFGPGASQVVEVRGRSVGVYNVEGSLYALRNVCPHHGAPLCLGSVTGRMLPSDPHVYEYGEENTVLRCPWHGYEFRISDGRSVMRPDKLRVRSYRVEVEDGDVVVYV